MLDIRIGIDTETVLSYLDAIKGNMEQVDGIIDQALQTGMEHAVERAKEIVPVDTGMLRDSIRYEGDSGVYTFIADARNPRTGEGYAIYPEYGSSKQIAQPYMRPALAEGVQMTIEQAKEELAKLLLPNAGIFRRFVRWLRR